MTFNLTPLFQLNTCKDVSFGGDFYAISMRLTQQGVIGHSQPFTFVRPEPFQPQNNWPASCWPGSGAAALLFSLHSPSPQMQVDRSVQKLLQLDTQVVEWRLKPQSHFLS